jgi:FlaA1/EpsC-like NDP-sugar epimerase
MRGIVGFLRLPLRRLVVYAYDFSAAGLSLVLAFFLRLGVEQPELRQELPALVAVFVLVAMVTFPAVRLNSGSWRYASVRDMLAIVQAATISLLVFTLVLFLWERVASLPRTVLVIEWFVLVAMLGGPRLAYRAYRDARSGRLSASGNVLERRVLLFGYCDEAEMFIRAVRRDPKSAYSVLAIFETNGKHIGRRMHGVPVLDLESLPKFAEEVGSRGTAPECIIIAPPRPDRALLSEIVALASRAGIRVDRLPNIKEVSGPAAKIGLKTQAVRLEDLLGRPEVTLDEKSINRLISGRRVLITGAGGSVGSQIAAQVLRFGAAQLTLVENSEFNLYEIDRQLRRDASQTELRPVLCDVRDRQRMMALMAREQPALVFHAAALKHVPMVEQNAAEAVLTNIFGVKNAADAAVTAGAEAFIMISTDKAVNPTSLLGLTKGLAERYCQMLDAAHSPTRFINVRFGNVLGSRGSVVPLFEEQLARGGPLTLTHPDVTRYMMTSSEAAQLVLQASAYGMTRREGGGEIYVLDMGTPVKIVDLARTIIQLAGLKPGEDIDIQYTGLRPGEKLTEELFNDDETVAATPVDGVLVATPCGIDAEALQQVLNDLAVAVEANDREGITRLLRHSASRLRQGGEVVPFSRSAEPVLGKT